MYLRFLGSSLIVVVILTAILTFKNYKNLYKFRDFSYPLEIKIALIYEAILDTRSDVYRIFDYLYKTEKNDLKKVYLNLGRGDLEIARNQWKQKTLLGDQTKKDFFSSTINFNSKNNEFQKSQFRFRGRSDWHLRLDKPSLRVKLRNYESYNMMRHLNFTLPEGRGMIENYYADLIAKKNGLIGHYGELVELHINNVNYGIYHLHSREDESLIRINKRMPSPLLLGQNLDIDKWNIKDFKIVNSKSITRNLDIFDRMIDEINKSKNTHEDWKNFWEIINYEQSAKFIAINSILGIIHNDYWHNHEFFYDRTLGKIEPIISDALSLGTYVYPGKEDRISLETFFSKEKPDFTIPINQKTNPFFNSLITDTNFYHRKNQIIDDLINDELSYENQSKLLLDIYNQIDNS
ncbi:CotH kinase family protein, partial [Candidatus Pelagibacter sp.]|nr:CotH kinase family protein [Candidatus Pelagibacter sp.]